MSEKHQFTLGFLMSSPDAKARWNSVQDYLNVEASSRYEPIWTNWAAYPGVVMTLTVSLYGSEDDAVMFALKYSDEIARARPSSNELYRRFEIKR